MKMQTFTFQMSGLLAALIFCCTAQTFAQEWAWMSGANTVNQTAVYGTQGTADPGNVPGARNGVVGWTDNEGNLWIFGGFGLATTAEFTGRLNDLWKYDVSTSQWTWMKGANEINSSGDYGVQGVASPTNEPPSRNRPLNWTDQDGNFWLFGGLNFNSERLNDLWKYDVATNQWTWMKGSSTAGPASVGVYGTLGVEDAANVPGGRNGGFNWVDNDGNLWLFGGTGFGADDLVQAQLNDLWKYNITTNNWTWMGGSNTNDPIAPAVYGEFRVPDPANTPGARVSSVSWTDQNGDFWLFGGGFGGGIANRGNDLWKYSVATGMWAWMDGDNIGGQAGVINIDEPENPTEDDNPGARNGSMGWTDNKGNLWLMGGWGLPVLGDTPGFLNDAWIYNPDENLWFYKAGPLGEIDNPGTYGTQGIPAPENAPSGRAAGANMVDNDGLLWLFGGVGGGRNNDLWQLSGDIFTDLEDINSKADGIVLNLFPNPNTGSFSLEYKEGKRYEILDAYGRLITGGSLSNSYLNNEWFVENVILQNLAPGIYIVRVLLDGKIGARKFIIDK